MAEKISLKERPAPGFEKTGWFSWFHQPPPVTTKDALITAYEFEKEDVDAHNIVQSVTSENPADGRRRTKRKYQQKKSKKKSKRKSKKKSQGKKK